MVQVPGFGNQIVYKNNPNLKSVGVIQNFTQEEIQEIAKCSNDPIYFINTYVKLVHIDHGLIQMKLRDYQEKMVRTYHKNRKSVTTAARQTGKCFCINTYVTIKHKDLYNGTEFQIKIGEFYEWIRFVRSFKVI